MTRDFGDNSVGVISFLKLLVLFGYLAMLVLSQLHRRNRVFELCATC
jgi:hypothetical protein